MQRPIGRDFKSIRAFITGLVLLAILSLTLNISDNMVYATCKCSFYNPRPDGIIVRHKALVSVGKAGPIPGGNDYGKGNESRD
jgi:hypothetical protein